MATKIRLQRGGRKNYAFYSIVIADVRAPRDGKFTEKIGTFNPMFICVMEVRTKLASCRSLSLHDRKSSV